MNVETSNAISDTLKRYCDTLVNSGYARDTVGCYMGDLGNFFDDPSIQLDINAGQFDTDSFRNYYDNGIQAGLRPTTLNRRMAALRGFCKWNEAHGQIDELRGIQIPVINRAESPPSKVIPLSATETDLMYGYFKRDERVTAFLDIAIGTGIHSEQILKLNTDNVRAAEDRVAIDFGDEDAKKTVTLTGDSVKRVLQLKEMRDYGRPDDETQLIPLFVSNYGNRLLRQGVWFILKQLDGTLGRRITTKTLRATFVASHPELTIDELTDRLGLANKVHALEWRQRIAS